MAPPRRTSLSLVVFASLANGSFYFSSLAGASDSNSGSSPSSPWRHLSKLDGLQLPPGSDVLLERGSVFIDDPIELLFPNKVTLGAYGNQSTPRPKIASYTLAGAVKCVSLVYPNSVLVTQLHLVGCTTGIGIAVSGGVQSNLTISNNVFRDVNAPDSLYNPPGSFWGKAIHIAGQGNISDMRIANNIGLRIDTFYQSDVYTSGVHLSENTVQGCYDNW
jgi:hypothetical protein